MIQNEEGCYSIAVHALKFEGSMFIYDPQRDISLWVPVRGTSFTLTLSELRVANDLNNMNPFPYDAMGLVQLQEQHPPMFMQGIPMGEESDMDSFDEPEPADSGDEWDKTECGDWSHCPSLPLGKGPTWAETTTELHRKIIWAKDTPTWQEVLGHSPHKDTQKQDSDWDEDPCVSVESQFKDATTAGEAGMDTVEEYTVGALPSEDTAEAPSSENIVEAPSSENTVEVLPSENIIKASIGPGSQDVVHIHVGNDDDLE